MNIYKRNLIVQFMIKDVDLFYIGLRNIDATYMGFFLVNLK